MNIGAIVKIKDDYPYYKSMRRLIGKVVWINNPHNVYMIETEYHPFHMKGRNTCFVEEQHVEVICDG